MNFLSEKINTITGPALSGVNELRRKQEKRSKTGDAEDENPQIASVETAHLPHPAGTGNELSSLPRRDFSVGFAFGGDSSNYRSPPTIGWRQDILKPDESLGEASPLNSGQASRPNYTQSDSNASLYEGDAWSRLWFQRIMVISFVRLIVFIRKVYEDYKATKTYASKSELIGFYILSVATLVLPTTIFTVYRVSRYLQINLPSSRLNRLKQRPISDRPTSPSEHAPQAAQTSETTQERRALLKTPNQQDEDGYGTARQTPITPVDPVLPLQGQVEPTVEVSAIKPDTAQEPLDKEEPVELSKRIQEFKETVNVDKLGDLPDKETTRVAIGASEQLLHGVLFIFWQLKRQVDLLSYLVERACLWRKPSDVEKEEIGRLQVGSDGLEWFQDFYAAFLAILTQVYLLGLSWSQTGIGASSSDLSSLTTATIGSASASLGSEIPSRTVNILGNILADDVKKAERGNNKDLLIFSEFMVSILVVFSLLVAVRRRDDGPLTLILSILGWGSLFASRIIAIAMGFVYIGAKIMLAGIIIHILGITGWVYKIALDSHRGKKSESDEWRWTIEDGPQESTESRQGGSIELQDTDNRTDSNIQQDPVDDWSIMEHIVLITQISTLFAVPSLFYWPIMFNLKQHARPYKYLVLILSENFILIPAIWFSMSNHTSSWPWYLLGAIGAFSIAGFFFISLYVCCKPSLTEYFARADQLFNEAENSGIYFEFCSRVFKMPDLSKEAFRRLMNQKQELVEVVEVERVIQEQ